MQFTRVSLSSSESPSFMANLSVINLNASDSPTNWQMRTSVSSVSHPLNVAHFKLTEYNSHNHQEMSDVL